MNEQTDKKKAAPYLAFKTFLNALDNVAAHSVPNLIDRSSFPSFSGGAVAAVLSAFRFFDLVDANGAPLMELHALAMNQSDREANIKALLEKYYGDLIALDLSRATPSQFDDAFSSEAFGVSGDTRVKAKTFFIKAAQFAGLPMSKLLLNKARASGPRKKRQPKNNGSTATNDAVTEKQHNAAPQPPNGSAIKTIELTTGGSVTLSVNVNLLDLEGADREFVFGLIDKLKKYEKVASPDAPADGEGVSE